MKLISSHSLLAAGFLLGMTHADPLFRSGGNNPIPSATSDDSVPSAPSDSSSPLPSGGGSKESAKPAAPSEPAQTSLPITEVALNPSKIDMTARTQWCLIHTSTCQNICLDKGSKAKSSTCDPNSLANSCVCANNFSPDTRHYTNTIPYFKCTTVATACEKDCNSQESCILGCRSRFNCVASDPPRSNTTNLVGANGGIFTPGGARLSSGADGQQTTMPLLPLVSLLPLAGVYLF